MKFTRLQNSRLLLFVNLIYYSIITLLVSLKSGVDFLPVFSLCFVVIVLLADYFFAGLSVRWFVRGLIIVVIYLIVRFGVSYISGVYIIEQTTDLSDTLLFVFIRNSFVPVIIVIFYMIVDGSDIKKMTLFKSLTSMIALIAVSYYIFKIDDNIRVSIFGNYINLLMILILVILIAIIKQIIFFKTARSMPVKKKDALFLLLLIIPFVVILSFVLLKSLIEEQNKSSNSGLFNQGIFMFDFSNFVELKDEIKLSDERVMIVELDGLNDSAKNRINEGWDRQLYLKRFSLELSTETGFKTSDDNSDPYTPPEFINDFMWEIPDPPNFIERSPVDQTLYLLNISGSSLMGSDLLFRVTPMVGWEDSPYKKIYRSTSTIYTGNYVDLVYRQVSQKRFLSSLSFGRKSMLLDYGNRPYNQRLKELAESITSGYDSIFLKSAAVQEYLTNNYFYSLKPGAAPNGDQLEHFLFYSKKGYCSYFAFAMVKILRSVGVASRVAVGFAPDMENKTLNFYEIRALDAHAWVEVYFDDYGWITFDPTSSNIAAGEEYEFAEGNKQERDDFIEGILQNKDKLRDILEREESASVSAIKGLIYNLAGSIRAQGLLLSLIVIMIVIAVIVIRKRYYYLKYLFSRSIKLKTINLYKAVIGELYDVSITINKDESVTDFAERIYEKSGIDIKELTLRYQKALFDRRESEIKENPRVLYSNFKKARKLIPVKQRFYGFINLARVFRGGLFVVILSLGFMNLHAQQTGSLFDYLADFNQAVIDGRSDDAQRIINAAEAAYPESPVPNLEKGIFFYNNELYNSAITELEKARNKNDKSLRLFNILAASYGKIGEDRKSLDTYIDALNYYPRSLDLIDSVGWMYYKTNDYQKGIDIINKGLEMYPNSATLMMTLATLYADSYNYEESKKYYLKSYQYSYSSGRSNDFRAIVYYNLSLLENTFMHYEDAYYYARKSLNYAQRSSGYVQLIYLFMSALEFDDAIGAVRNASSYYPTTWFPKAANIEIDILAGRLDEAEQICLEIINDRDYGWMLYFGTNPDLFKSDIYDNLAEIYYYRMKTNRYRRISNIKDLFVKIYRNVEYYFKLRLFDYKAAKLRERIIAEETAAGGYLDSLKKTFDSIRRTTPSKALGVLNKILNIERSIMPEIDRIRLVDIEETRSKTLLCRILNRGVDCERLSANLELLDKKWEREYIARTIALLYKFGNSSDRVRYSQELYSVLPSLLPYRGIPLFAEIMVDPVININQGDLRGINIYNNQLSGISVVIRTVNDGNDLEVTISGDDFRKEKTLRSYKGLSKSELLNLIYNAAFVIDFADSDI